MESRKLTSSGAQFENSMSLYENSIAAHYDSEEGTYVIDDIIVYDGTLYKCTDNISIPEAFTSAHWQAIQMFDNDATKWNCGDASNT